VNGVSRRDSIAYVDCRSGFLKKPRDRSLKTPYLNFLGLIPGFFRRYDSDAEGNSSALTGI